MNGALSLLGEDGLFSDLFHWLEHRAGYRAASREIEDLLDGVRPDTEIIARRQLLFTGRRSLFQGPFATGWGKRWVEFGAADARRGECHADRFDCHSYKRGWAEQMSERHKYGWHHPVLDRYFEQLAVRP